MGFGRFWRGYDWVARFDLAVGWIFDWRNWLWGLVPGGGGMTLLWGAIDNHYSRSPLDIWVLTVIVMAGLAIFVYVAIFVLEKIRNSKAGRPTASNSAPNEFASDIPDIRIADSPDALSLFDGANGDKLIPLLEGEKIASWGRPRGMGESPLLRVPGALWRTHRIEFHPSGGVDGRINQTFLKRGSETHTYYDISLNRAQLKRIWPNFQQVTPSLIVRWPDFDKWDKRKDFRLFEIACLWTDQEPGLPLTTEASRCFKILEQAIWDKRLKIRSDSIRQAIANAKIIREGREAKANPNWMIEREPLLLYASGTDEKPRFLFPEERV
jgi:hypothetical protein